MSEICVIGDVHGHLQLALLIAARWQLDLSTRFDAVFLVGDVGTFADDSQLDKATRRHLQENPCEIEVLRQWMTSPPAPWLGRLFRPVEAGGLGLCCPVVMVHGNHEGFEHLVGLVPKEAPDQPVPIDELPRVDPGRRLSYLPSGWRTQTADGLLVAGLGGIERDQRKTGYHPMAYITEDQILALTEGEPVDVLITHTGPAATQPFPRGAPLLDMLLDAQVARTWFHGHSIEDDGIREIGGTTLVPLHGAPFRTRGDRAGVPGEDAWCYARFTGGAVELLRERPAFWREFHQRGWVKQPDGQLVAPQLAP